MEDLKDIFSPAPAEVPADKYEAGSVHWQSPSNIAIIKYWGKRPVQLPQNPSLSLTLTNARTETRLSYEPKDSDGMELEFFFDGEPAPRFRERVLHYLESVKTYLPFLERFRLTVQTVNSFPHSAGIASSASAMSALALCLCSMEDKLFGSLSDDSLFDKKASFLARLGSGSAARSIFGYAALWGQASRVPESSDLFAVSLEDRLHPVFKNFHDDILIVSADEKPVSSRAGHQLMDTNPYAPARYARAKQRLDKLLDALSAGDVARFGQIAEQEALELHGLMMTSEPPYLLMQPETVAIIERLRRYREREDIPVFFTLDAGPNVHLLYPEEVIADVRGFLQEELAPYLLNNTFIPDFVGEGPEEV